MERRNFKRQHTRIAIEVLARGGRMKAQLDNLSVTGCRIECEQNWLEKGEFVRLNLPGDLEVEGQVAWIMRNRIGVQFAKTLEPAIVRKLGFE